MKSYFEQRPPRARAQLHTRTHGAQLCACRTEPNAFKYNSKDLPITLTSDRNSHTKYRYAHQLWYLHVSFRKRVNVMCCTDGCQQILTVNSPTDSPAAGPFSASFRFPNRCQCPGPSSVRGFCRPPTISTAIVAYRRVSPANIGKSVQSIIVHLNIVCMWMWPQARAQIMFDIPRACQSAQRRKSSHNTHTRLEYSTKRGA